ncbi:glycoside hydrolase family 3 N-terminal domain-containing protein [Pseudocolwellia sp. HL-MZ7]|uniref:glycoside hydrolase family 3 protein n=1 Tax=Pseudocolwellia sp. HL-MZ7 TaxID=3400627 RepID=UPI003CEBDC9E
MNYKYKFWVFFAVFIAVFSLLFYVYSQPVVDEKVDEQELSSIPKYWPKIESKIAKDDDIEKRITDILASMTVEQKVAQIIQPEIKSITVDDMRKYGFGSYLNGASSFPLNNKEAEVQDWVNYSQAMFEAAKDDTLDGSTIPTMWATDAMHGHAKIRGATVFPHNIGLGAANNIKLIEEIAKVTAIEVNVTGIDWVFAPTVTAPRNDRWGRTYEGYSEDPEIISTYAKAFIQGMQGELANDENPGSKSIATLKHFIGDGGTQFGVDQGDNLDTESELFKKHAQGYVTGLKAGAQTVMASFNSWHGKKNHGNEYLLTKVLKERMGFDGVVVGDWNGHGQVKGCTNDNCPQAFNAGLDVYMVAGDSWKPLYQNTLEQVNSGIITQKRLDDAVSRMLRIKLRSGLFEKKAPIERSLVNQPELLGTDSHRKLARQAVRESLVLLKNNNQLLPLSANQHILVAGDAADNIGKQSGAWTISWQSADNKNSDFPNATSIYKGIAEQVKAAGGSVELDINGNYNQKPDVAIVVFGEEAYAEGVGDRDSIEYQPSYKKDLALLKKLKADNIPVVSIFISGRPMWVNPELNQSDAFIAAWLPGSEGEGIADVILRDVDDNAQFDFTGKLSFSWPKTVAQTDLNYGDDNYAPLFEYGYGLTHSDNTRLNSFDETVSLNDKAVKGKFVLFDKNFIAPWYPTIVNQEGTSQIDSNQFENNLIRMEAIDKNIQEDARKLSFLGVENVAYSITTAEPVDLSMYAQSSYVNINVLINSKPSDAVFMKLSCNESCGKIVELTKSIAAIPTNQWTDIAIPLHCFDLREDELLQVNSPVVIETKGEFSFSFSSISIESSIKKRKFIRCD